MNAKTDAKPFTEMLKDVAEFFDTTISPGRSTMFFGALIEYDFEIVRLAFSKFMQSADSKYGFPRPIAILDIIIGSQSEMEANAWNAIGEAIRRVGSYQSIIIEDPSVADALVRVFGSWISCCAERAIGNAFLWEGRRKEFVEAYRVARKIQRADRTPVLLGGTCEMANRTANRFPKRQDYGVILLDGSVRKRYLDIDAATGLPVSRLADIPGLPDGPPQKALPAPVAVVGGTDELVSGEAMIRLEDAFTRLLSSRSFPRTAAKPITIPIDEPDAERRAELRRQAEIITRAETTAKPVRPGKAAATGKPDRTSDDGGKTAKVRNGVPVRQTDRPKLESRSRVAGVPDPVRDRGKQLRERDSRGKRNVDNQTGQRRKGSR
jgi:hypothetical protein